MARWASLVGEGLSRARVCPCPWRPPQLLQMSWKTPGMPSGQKLVHLH